MSRLQGKVAVITGAASGIGLACARRFAEEGAQVVGLDLGAPPAEFPGLFMVLDVCDEAAVERVMGEVVARHARLDVLVNAAGIASRGSITETSTEEWRRVLEVHLTGSMLASRHALPQMLVQRSGSIINFGSVFGLQGCDGNAAYNTAKGGISQLTRSMAIDYGHANVRVNGLCPGLIDTPMTRMVKEQEAFHAFFASQHMLCRAGQPEEVAGAALFLASDDASFVSGQMIAVDGGFSAGRRFVPPQG
ncbi:SDR family NAD(P)-dependent oxidoreductase [Pseudomonas aeruginosa]|uniref:SDR family oxidoreductase n=1 Tax=Pseudomonas aeruginosa TaxID=287 RepID=A0A6A9JVC0_PSEAI|nr:SDR family oxidoreductase [Pseudomonas aeruginosa]MBG7461258.1 SDR family oxidoreductase [Pseudomonas aeruginosa]MBV5796761.1 SDR family oxidoreductase [Pseudomonas aeruginosa]MDG3711688.1 SDR family oxidoreductase [Pseudomonas aeruginosa]MDG3816266.1 SDR family oxidoreductase [Pseudomonas aeruginosa]MUI56811.1 SDR family oxidoreductase [Pseudomonas aeruginosa]